MCRWGRRSWNLRLNRDVDFRFPSSSLCNTAPAPTDQLPYKMAEGEEYPWESIGAPKEEEEAGEEGTEHISEDVIMIDANLLRLPCNIQNDEFRGKSCLEASAKATSMLMRAKLWSTSACYDKLGVLFFSTNNTSPSLSGKGFTNVYQLTSNSSNFLDNVTIQSILQLSDDFSDDSFDSQAGGVAKTATPEDKTALFNNALQAVAALLPPQRANIKVSRRLLIFTADRIPADFNSTVVKNRLTTLAEKGCLLQLCPFVHSEQQLEAFIEPFWKHALHILSGISFSEGGEYTQEEHGKGRDQHHLDDDIDDDDAAIHQIIFPSDLNQIQVKSYKKRTTGTIPLKLGPQGPKLMVKRYTIVSKATPVRPIKVHQDPSFWKRGAVKPKTAKLDYLTGEILGKEDIRFFWPKEERVVDLGDDGGGEVIVMPKQYITKTELAQLKYPLDKGLVIIGFKTAVTFLKPWHQMKASSFIYPDNDKIIKGSWTAFVALHKSMIDGGKVAVCTYVSTRNSEPKLVALLPSREEYDEYGIQVSPPGMYVYRLPYDEDVRWPEKVSGKESGGGGDKVAGSSKGAAAKRVVGQAIKEPNANQMEAAEKLVDKLEDTLFLENFRSWHFPNPHLQRQYAVLEAQASNKGVVEARDAHPDETVPDVETVDIQCAHELEEFIIAHWGSIESHELDKQGKKLPTAGGGRGGGKGKEAGGIKRKAKGKTVSGDNDDEEEMDINYEQLAEDGQLGTLTVAELKKILGERGLTVSGKKSELVARIMNDIERLRSAVKKKRSAQVVVVDDDDDNDDEQVVGRE